MVDGVDNGPMLPVEAGEIGSAMRAAAEFRNSRRELHHTECARLADELALVQLHLPMVAGSQLDAASIDALAEHWSDS